MHNKGKKKIKKKNKAIQAWHFKTLAFERLFTINWFKRVLWKSELRNVWKCLGSVPEHLVQSITRQFLRTYYNWKDMFFAFLNLIWNPSCTLTDYAGYFQYLVDIFKWSVGTRQQLPCCHRERGLGNTRISVVKFSLHFLKQAIIMNRHSFLYFRWHFD